MSHASVGGVGTSPSRRGHERDASPGPPPTPARLDCLLPGRRDGDGRALGVGLRPRRSFSGGRARTCPAASRGTRVALRRVGCRSLRAPARRDGRVRCDVCHSGADRDRAGGACARVRRVPPGRRQQRRRDAVPLSAPRDGPSRRSHAGRAGGDERHGEERSKAWPRSRALPSPRCSSSEPSRGSCWP